MGYAVLRFVVLEGAAHVRHRSSDAVAAVAMHDAHKKHTPSGIAGSVALCRLAQNGYSFGVRPFGAPVTCTVWFASLMTK